MFEYLLKNIIFFLLNSSSIFSLDKYTLKYLLFEGTLKIKGVSYSFFKSLSYSSDNNLKIILFPPFIILFLSTNKFEKPPEVKYSVHLAKCLITLSVTISLPS